MANETKTILTQPGSKVQELLDKIVPIEERIEQLESNGGGVDPEQLEMVIGLSIPHDVNVDFNNDFAI